MLVIAVVRIVVRTLEIVKQCIVNIVNTIAKGIPPIEQQRERFLRLEFVYLFIFLVHSNIMLYTLKRRIDGRWLRHGCGKSVVVSLKNGSKETSFCRTLVIYGEILIVQHL